MQSVFSRARAIRTTRASKRVRASARQIVKIAGPDKTKVAEEIAKFVLKKVPLSVSRGVDIDFAKMKFRRSFSKKAEQTLANDSTTGLMPCIERCNLALSLFRKAKIPAWLTREIFFEPPSISPRVHDYVEFFTGGKVRTLALGFGLESQSDMYKIYDAPMKDTGFGKIFRGIESSQIGGAKSYKKYLAFAKEAFSSKQALKDKKRLELLVASGVIPKEAYNQILGRSK